MPPAERTAVDSQALAPRWRRGAGSLLHVTSLPGTQACGDLGPMAHRYARWLGAAEQSWWQMLPIGPPGPGGSPYSATSSFAGAPLLISAEALVEEGLLDAEDAAPVPTRRPDRSDFTRARSAQAERLERAFGRFQSERPRGIERAFEAFRERESWWLADATLFRALRRAHRGKPWMRWDEEVRLREPAALRSARRRLARVIEQEAFVQFLFDRQWQALRRTCREAGVGLIGDVPFYPALNSDDVWANQELFLLDEHGCPREVAGVPPDYFSATGQKWNNPLYRWRTIRADGYRWWLDRMRITFERFDAVRIDHFIGFHRSWAVPAGARNAKRGRWLAGPREDFFRALFEAIPRARIIAEDLGLVVKPVERLRDQFELPGLRVIQFGFGDDQGESEHLPHHYPVNSVAYTGTHDNDTIAGWLRGRAPGGRSAAEARAERARAMVYLGRPEQDQHWAMVRAVWASVAHTAIAPAQDLLSLRSHARMNRPGSAGGNWTWRLAPGQLDRGVAERLAGLTRMCGRGRRSGDRRGSIVIERSD